MTKILVTPYPTLKKGIPLDLRYNYIRGMLTTLFKGFMYVIREKFGAAIALELAERMWKFDDRLKNMTKSILNVFKIDGNNVETIMKWWEIFLELCGHEATWLELTKTYVRIKITKCPWSTPDPVDIRGWCIIFCSIINKSINSSATTERLKGLCAGDAYCEYIYGLEE